MSKSATATTSHDTALAARHARLEAQLERESMRPHPDSAMVAQIKKAKLRIKDALLRH